MAPKRAVAGSAKAASSLQAGGAAGLGFGGHGGFGGFSGAQRVEAVGPTEGNASVRRSAVATLNTESHIQLRLDPRRALLASPYVFAEH